MTKKSRLAKLLTKMNSRRPLKTRRPRRLGVQQLETRKMLDGNDTFDEAFNIGSLADQTELDSDQLTTGFSINPVTDVDMFSFQALRGQRVEVEIDGDGSSPSHRIRLFSPDIRYDFIENLTAYSDGTLSFNATESSTFYVGVSEASNGSYSPITGNGDLVSPGARTGGFTLRVRLQNGTPPPPSIVDLQPESPIAPPTARPGSTIRPLIEIDNTGTGSASQFKVDFYLSTNTYISSFDTKLATVTRPGVAAGGSDSWIQDLAIPSDLSAGTYYLGMIVDADGLVDDVPSTSNIEYTSIIIENAPPPPPPSVVDLDPEIPVAPPSANTGNSIDVRVEVDNTGTGDAGQYDVDFYLSTNSYISSFDTKLATETRFGIAAGGSDSWSQRLTIPSDLAPGIYYLGIIVDADGLVDDVPGTSNVEYTQITILDIPTPPPPPPATNGDAVGFYNPNQAMFELRSHLGPNADVDRVSGQSVPANFIPLVGDWNGDGVETLGFYDPASSVFHLSNRSGSTSSDIRFQYGPSGFAGWTPLAGDWNGDGIDTIGFYQPDLSLFHLKDSFTAGASDQYFGFGPSGNAGWTPMVGDWNGDGVDTVGFYEPGQSLFHLKDSFTPGRSDQYFGFGPAFGGWTPLAGDWNGDGVDTIGLYDRTGSMFHLKDSFTHGASDHYVGWAASEFQGVPIVGRWGDSQNDPPVPFPEVPTYGSFNDWNLNLIGAPEAWAQGHTGDGVLVAVLDSGIDFNHPDLLQSLHRNYADPIDGIDNDGNGYTDDFIGYDFANGDEFPEDTDGHGTHVAGTIAAARNGVGATGVAYDAKILPVKVFGDGPFNADGYIDAIKYAIKMGADIINMSLGGGYDPAEEAAIQLAAQHDILVV
ncbi:MAG: S8 family serine peptidase, partial [Planctomycetota bacterium]